MPTPNQPVLAACCACANVLAHRSRRTASARNTAPVARSVSPLLLALMALVLWVQPLPARAEDPPVAPAAIERVALYAASNAGSSDRDTLRYAESDAHALSRVLRRVGGVRARNEVLVYGATPRQLQRGFARVARRSGELAAKGHRVEFIFYYSGHSDESGLLLGDDRLTYADLHAQLDNVPADVRIAILDSCASGAFTRTKGGTKRAPFLVDAGSNLSGHAYLTSSSVDENAQEADRIGGSFFTHFLSSGLQGAADSDRDRVVTLDEAYRFAFEETLAHTETSRSGAQHAAYDIDLSGSGDLVMTDLRRTTGRMVLDARLEGRVSVRSTSGRYAAELRMPGNEQPVVLALEQGGYTVTVDNGRRLARATIEVPSAGRVEVTPSQLTKVKRQDTTARGAKPTGEYVHVPVNVGLMPALSVGGRRRPVITHFGAALLWSHSARTHGLAAAIAVDVTDEEVRGAQWTVGASISRGNVVGTQMSAGINWASGDVRGVQMATGFNGVPSLHGVQLSSGVNYARDFRGAQVGLINASTGTDDGAQVGLLNVGGDVQGVQFGLFNYARSAKASIGLLSITKEGGVHPEVWTSDTAAFNVGLRFPARYTYSFIAAGLHPAGRGRGWQFGFGLGGHIPVRESLSVDVDVAGYTVNGDLGFGEPMTSLFKVRAMVAWQFMPRLTLWGGPTFNTHLDDARDRTARPGYPWVAALRTRNNSRVRLWPGFVAGLRF